MKSFLRLSLMAIIASFVLVACSKDEDGEAEVKKGEKSGTFSCKVDGVDFIADSLNCTLIGNDQAKRLDVRAINAAGEYIIVTVNDVTALDEDFSHLGDSVSTKIDTDKPSYILTLGTFVNSDNTVMSSSISDKVGYSMITSSDLAAKKVSGVFEFSVENFNGSHTITDGKFDVTYTVYKQ